jgi:hypothetical protein
VLEQQLLDGWTRCGSEQILGWPDDFLPEVGDDQRRQRREPVVLDWLSPMRQRRIGNPEVEQHQRLRRVWILVGLDVDARVNAAFTQIPDWSSPHATSAIGCPDSLSISSAIMPGSPRFSMSVSNSWK